MRASNVVALSLALLGAVASAAAAPRLVITGELRAQAAQPVLTPMSNFNPVVLRYYLPEGTRVAVGDVVLRIDPGDAANQIALLESQIEQAEARAEKEVAELQVRAIDAELALVEARATHDKARIDAAIPREYLTALDHDRYQGELARADAELTLKQTELDSARAAIARRQTDARLEVEKLQADLRFWRVQLAAAEVRAERAGVLVHGFDSQRGARFDEGSSANSGAKVGEIVGEGPLGVVAYALEADRPLLAAGQAVRLRFDALPSLQTDGVIEEIAGAPEARVEWGEGRYFPVRIAFEAPSGATLLPGMSVRVEVVP